MNAKEVVVKLLQLLGRLLHRLPEVIEYVPLAGPFARQFFPTDKPWFKSATVQAGLAWGFVAKVGPIVQQFWPQTAPVVALILNNIDEIGKAAMILGLRKTIIDNAGAAPDLVPPTTPAPTRAGFIGIALVSLLLVAPAQAGIGHSLGVFEQGLSTDSVAGAVGLRLNGQVDPPALYEGLAYKSGPGALGKAGLYLGEDIQTLKDGRAAGGLSLMVHAQLYDWIGAGLGAHVYQVGTGVLPISKQTAFLVATASFSPATTPPPK